MGSDLKVAEKRSKVLAVIDANLIGDSAIEIVLKNDIIAKERAAIKELQALYLRNLIIFTFKKFLDSWCADYRSIRDRWTLLQHCSSEQMLSRFLKQAEQILETSARMREKTIKRFGLILWLTPILGWAVLYKNRGVISVRNYNILSALNIKRTLAGHDISTEKLIDYFANNTLSKDIDDYAKPNRD